MPTIEEIKKYAEDKKYFWYAFETWELANTEEEFYNRIKEVCEHFNKEGK